MPTSNLQSSSFVKTFLQRGSSSFSLLRETAFTSGPSLTSTFALGGRASQSHSFPPQSRRQTEISFGDRSSGNSGLVRPGARLVKAVRARLRGLLDSRERLGERGATV